MSGATARIGDVLESAAWFHRDDPESQQKARRVIRKAFENAEKDRGCICGPIKWHTLEPGQDRCPTPPEHVGKDPRLLVGEAELKAIRRKVKRVLPGLVGDLEPKDLERLRAATRRGHEAARPHDPRLTDEQCDAVINEIGIKTVQKMLRKGAH